MREVQVWDIIQLSFKAENVILEWRAVMGHMSCCSGVTLPVRWLMTLMVQNEVARNECTST